MLKAIIRKEALIARNSLSADDVWLLSLKLLEGFKKLNFSKINSVHVFLPIVDKNEPNTFLILDWLQATHPVIQIIVPKAEFDSHALSHHIYSGPDDLVKNKYQIPEPQHAPLFIGVPDMVLVPLLAFDTRGYRVGYGKGFYDRFLQNINTLKVGLSLFDQVENIEDVHEHDVKLDLCITPDKIVNFTDENAKRK